MDLKQRYGEWALISGASEGTGAAFAREVAKQGMNCLLIARREQPLQQLAEELTQQYNVQSTYACIDLASADAFERIKKATAYKQVGLFISNAGADSTNSHFLATTPDTWLAQIDRSIITVTQCCHHLATQMRAVGRGGILLVGSGACYGGAAYMAVYSAIKAFTMCFAEGLWAELKDNHIDVLNLVLGQTDTPALRASLAKSGHPVPDNLASPTAVAQIGLQQLPNGPVFNWGQTDDEAGFAPNTPAQRRARTEAISQAPSTMFAAK